MDFFYLPLFLPLDDQLFHILCLQPQYLYIRTLGGFICTFSNLISLSIPLRSSKFRNQLLKTRDIYWSYLF